MVTFITGLVWRGLRLNPGPLTHMALYHWTTDAVIVKYEYLLQIRSYT